MTTVNAVMNPEVQKKKGAGISRLAERLICSQKVLPIQRIVH
jgi:hypothetical protein